MGLFTFMFIIFLIVGLLLIGFSGAGDAHLSEHERNSKLGLFDDDDEETSSASHGFDTEFNPATGLPMVGALDIAGNLFGTNSSSIGGDDVMDIVGLDSGISGIDDSLPDISDSFSSMNDSFSSFDDW